MLQQADLIEAERVGRSIIYRLKMSVLEEALFAFAQTLKWEMKGTRTSRPAVRRRALRGEV